MALKHIKSKIKATQRTSKVTKAMEAVSAVKMRKSQERALGGRPYAEAAFRILQNIARSFDVQHHSFVRGNGGTHDCVVVVTSDKGLAGSLNSSVLKEAMRIVETKDKKTVELICFGKKAYEHFTRRGYTVSHHYLNMGDEVMIQDFEALVEYIGNEYRRGHLKNVQVVYQQFVSTFEQRTVVRKLLPITLDEVRAMIQDILPQQGKFSTESLTLAPINYTAEQNRETLFDSIFDTIINIMLYHALLESKASEHSARMVAMKNATDKAKEVVKALTLIFNKERQGVITAEVSEITGGIEALKNT